MPCSPPVGIRQWAVGRKQKTCGANLPLGSAVRTTGPLKSRGPEKQVRAIYFWNVETAGLIALFASAAAPSSGADVVKALRKSRGIKGKGPRYLLACRPNISLEGGIRLLSSGSRRYEADVSWGGPEASSHPEF